MRGWLLDLYEDAADGLSLWFITEEGQRVRLRQQMPVSFYAAGENETLRRLWKMLRGHPAVLALGRETRRDVFLTDPVTVLKVRVDSPLAQRRLFQRVQQLFPDLTYYDSDIPFHIHHAARYGSFPMAFCEIDVDDEGGIRDLRVLNSRWDLAPMLPVFRSLSLRPDCDPACAAPGGIYLQSNGRKRRLPLGRGAELIHRLNRVLEETDPDFIFTHWGDTWLIPTLLELSEGAGIRLRLNRDERREVHWQKALTYFSYGQIIFRSEEAHLFGRCHIDERNAMMWGDYGLDGVLESARVTTQPIERAARVSPGSGISAMQALTALEKGILVPWHKQQVEAFKSGVDLIQRDRGGLIYQPIVGLHSHVAQIDFISMYPAIIIKGNISPEVPLPHGFLPASAELGVVPLTLKPLYEKRVALKLQKKQHPERSPLARRLGARASALKWLLVVCFGFLGYKNARFGRIEAHEAVTNGGREILLRAKEVAEAMGFEVLHMYVDALWLKKEGACDKEHFQEVIAEISSATGLGISLDGIYRWIAFLPSRVDSRVPVASRYFGVLQDGSLTVRGIEARRRDTPPWIVETQLHMLQCLARALSVSGLPEYIGAAFYVFQTALQALRAGQVPLEKLVVTSRISRELEAYHSPTPAVRAALLLLEQTGRRIRPGQKIRFVYTRGAANVFPWESPHKIAMEAVDLRKYTELLARAASNVLLPFGIQETALRRWAHDGVIAPELALNPRLRRGKPGG